ncbi:MAG: hypothetical protein SFW67_23780 [Myxococcaceae bacterium]|nr:hypothetical protein [Myxococcaceae bacterium]
MPTKLERERLNQLGRERFLEGLATFAARWRALGYDPTVTFLEQVKGRRGFHPREVASRCVRLAEEVYGVRFVGRTRAFDEEHGDVQRVGRAQLVSFYESPAHVLAITLRKLQGRSQRTDDILAPGLSDEVLLELRRLS